MLSSSSLLWFLLLSSSPLIINPIISIGIVDAQAPLTSYYQHELFLQSLRVQVNSTSSSSSFIDLGNETLSISALVDVLVFGSGDVVSSSSSNNNNNNNNKLNVFKSAPNSVFVVTRNNLATTTATTMNSNSFLQNNYYGYQQPGQVPQIFSSVPRIQYFSTSTKESWVISSSGSTTSSGVSLDLTSGTSTNPINTIKVNLSSPSLVDTYYNAFERYVSMIPNNKNNTLFKYYCGSSSSLYKCCQDPTNVSNIIAYYLDYNFSDPIICTRNTFSTTSSSPLVSVGVPINLDFSMITPSSSSSSSGSRQKQFLLNSTSLFDSLTATNQQSSSSSSSPPSIALLDYADQTRKEQVSVKILLNDKYSTTTTTTAQQTLDSIYSSIVDATSPTLNKRFCFHQFPDSTLPSSSLLLSSFMAPNTTVFGSTRNHLGYFADIFARTDKQCDQPGVFYTAVYSPPSNVVDPLNQLAAIFDRYSIANNIKNNDLFLASSYDQTTSIDLIQSNYANSDNNNNNNNNLMLLNSMDFAFSDPAEKRNVEIQVDAVFQMGSEILKRLFPVNVISDSSFFGYFSSSEITGINLPSSSSTARTSLTFTSQKFTFDLNLTFCVDISNRAGVTSPSGSLIFSIPNLDCDSSPLFVATESKNDSFSFNDKNNNNSATSASSLIRSSISCSNFRFSSSSSSSSSFTTISPIDRPSIPVFKTQKFCISGAQIQIDFEFQINISSSSSTELPLAISDLQSIKNQIYQKYFNNSDDDDNVSFHRMISGSAVLEVQDLAGKIIIDVPMNWSYDFVPQKIKSTEFKNNNNEFLRTSSSSLDENSFLTSFAGDDIFVKTRMKDNNAPSTTFFFNMSSSNLISFVQSQYCPYLHEQQNYFSDAASRVGKLVQQLTSSSSICLIIASNNNNNNTNRNNSNFSTQANTTINNLLMSDSVCKLIFGDSSFLISESSSSSLFLPTCQPPRSLKIINPANFTPQNLLDFHSESDGIKTNNNNTAFASEEIFDELIDTAIEHRLQDRCSSDFASLGVASTSSLAFHISSPSPSVANFVKTQQSRVLYNASKIENEVNDKTLFLHQLNLTRLIVEVENRQREIDAEREIQVQKIKARHITVACFVSLDVILAVMIICFFITSKSRKLQKFFGIERWFSRNLGKNSNCDGNQRENSETSNSDNASTSSEAEVASSPFNNSNLFHHHARVRRHRSSSNYKNRDIASSPVGFNDGIEFERSPSPTKIEIASSSPFHRISESNHFPSSEMNNNRKASGHHHNHNQKIHHDRTHVSSRSKSSPPSKNIIAPHQLHHENNHHQSSMRSVSRSNNNKNNINFNNNETHPLFTNVMNHHQHHPHRSSSRNQSNDDHSQGDNFLVSVIPRAFEQSIGAETDLAMFSNNGFKNRGNNFADSNSTMKNHNNHKRSSSCASNNNNINNNSSSFIYQQNNQNTEHRASRSGSVTSAVAAKSTVTHDSTAASFFPTQSFSRRPSCANPSCPPQQRNGSQERHMGRDSRNNGDDNALTAGTTIGKSISRRMSSSNAGWSDYSPEILHQTHGLNKQEALQFNQGLHHHSQSRHDEEFYYFTQQQQQQQRQQQSQNDDDCCSSKNQKYRASSSDGNRWGNTMISNQNAAATTVPSSSLKNEQNCDSSKRKRSSIVNNNNINNSDRSSSNNSAFSATTRNRRRTSSNNNNNNGSRTKSSSNSSSSAQDDAQQHQDLYFGDELNNKKMRKPSTKMNNRNNNNNDENKDFSFSVG